MRGFYLSKLAVPAVVVGLILTGCPDDEPSGGSLTPGDTSVSLDTGNDGTIPSTDPGPADAEPDTPSPEDVVTPEVSADTQVPDAPEDSSTVDLAPAPHVTCVTDDACDDGLDCTDDACVDSDDGGKICQWQLKPDTCLINFVCRASGDTRPGQPCQSCDPAVDDQAWTLAADDSACDDGSACTENDLCEAGTCSGTALDCDDSNPCSVDSCTEADGCVNATDPNGTCDDGDPCTEDDSCATGDCLGNPVVCDDDNPCTDDACTADAAGCVFTNNTAPCDTDDDACTDEVCADGGCTSLGALNCDDGNLCTINTCDTSVGCYTLPNNNPCCIGETSVCEDGDPCTTDNCDPAAGTCDYQNNTATCDDDNICTTNDACDGAGTCSGTVATCDDNNPCTIDICDPSQGCVSTIGADGTPCDDGLECSTGDACVAGACVGDTSECVCIPEFQDGGKVNALSVGADATEGNAIDVDGNGSLDNVLGGIVATVGANDAIVASVGDGSLTLLVDFREFSGGDGPFILSLHQGELDPGNPTCDFQTATCDYLATTDLIDADTCAPTIQLPVTNTGGAIAGGGPGNNFPFAIPISDTASLALVVYNVKIEGSITVTSGNVTAFDGILGGAVTKSDLESALNALPEGTDLGGFTVDQIIPLLNLLPDDIDLDGDTAPDAMSIGIILSGIDANIVGVTP